MFYIVYKTTNLLDRKYYIGCHQTDNLYDGYLGSGKHLKRAIKKYGVENFTREILYSFETKEEMFLKEQELVDKECVEDCASYNLKVGGSGGNPGIVGAFKGRTHSEESKEKIRQKALQQITTDEKRKKISNNSWAKRDPTAQREHAVKIASKPKSDQHKKKISESLKNAGKHKTVICPHCKKKGGERAMKRWHFAKCKNKTSQA